jgi:hypothetical protein
MAKLYDSALGTQAEHPFAWPFTRGVLAPCTRLRPSLLLDCNVNCNVQRFLRVRYAVACELLVMYACPTLSITHLQRQLQRVTVFQGLSASYWGCAEGCIQFVAYERAKRYLEVSAKLES